MSPEDFRAQLEYEFNWRQKELALLKNQLSNIPEADKKTYCKALIIMLYSHFEGFCRMAFLTYIKLINDEKITRSDAKEHIIASSLLDVFRDIENPDKPDSKRCKTFKISSDETKFQKFFLHIQFIREFETILQQKIDISDKLSKDIADPESNLGPKVMQKILYRLGLPYDKFNEYTGVIQHLRLRRDDFAHGEPVEGIKEKDYRDLEEKVYIIISDLIMLLTNAAENKSYLRTANTIEMHHER